ncbi:MAG: hypothetical protein ACRCVI_01380 [Mycoplasmoidaceae bacterium]
MSYYTRNKYRISSHAIKRYQERIGKELSFAEVENAIYLHLDNTYEGEKLNNGDIKLMLFDYKDAYFICSSDNLIKTFWKK